MSLRPDLAVIARHVAPGSRVLDVGCGEGELMAVLRDEKQVDARGMEIDPEAVEKCVARGLSAVQGDADRDLADYPSKAFDYAILSQTLQTVRDPRAVLNELMRIAEHAIVSFPNFGHWSVRWSLLTKGRMPTTRSLPAPWWATPNIHLCTLRDFTDLVGDLDLRVEAASALIRGKPARAMSENQQWENWRAEQAIFLLGRREAAREAPPEPPTDRLF